jgi:uncharacterized phage infection (PIP) family protein YhgE
VNHSKSENGNNALMKTFTHGYAYLFACTLCAAMPSWGQVTANLDELTAQWLALDKSTQQLKSEWQIEKQQLKLRIGLLKQENSQLSEQIKQEQHNQDEVGQQRQALLSAQTEIEQVVDTYRLAFPSMLSRVQELLAALPPYLELQLADDISKLTEKSELTAQYQAIANIAKQVAKAEDLIVVKQGMLTLNGTPLLTEQLYLGYRHAWFITQDNATAGIGYPSADGWQWQAVNTADHSIRQAIISAKNQVPGELLQLPVNLGAK